MAFVVMYDASVLFGNTARDLLIRVCIKRLVEGRWTERILDELDAALVKRYRLPWESITERRARMTMALPGAMVSGYEPLMPDVGLRDPNDVHVLAAAIHCGAQVIVTADRDFTRECLAPYNMEAKSLDDFMMDLYDLHPGPVYACIEQIAAARRRPPQSIDQVIDELARNGLIEFAAMLRSDQ